MAKTPETPKTKDKLSQMRMLKSPDTIYRKAKVVKPKKSN